MYGAGRHQVPPRLILRQANHKQKTGAPSIGRCTCFLSIWIVDSPVFLFADDFRGDLQLAQLPVAPVVGGHQAGDLSLGLLHLRLEGPGGQP